MKKKLALFTTIITIILSFTSCQKDDYIKYDDVRATNGYIKGTITGTTTDGTVVNESINLTASYPGRNNITTFVSSGTINYNFNVRNNNAKLNPNYSSEVYLNIAYSNSIARLSDFEINFSKTLSGNRILDIDVYSSNNLGITDFIYDSNTNKISGKITGNIRDGNNTYDVDLSFDTTVWEEVK